MKKLRMFTLIIFILSSCALYSNVSYERFSLEKLGRRAGESSLDFTQRVGTQAIIENLMKTGDDKYIYVVNLMNVCPEDMSKLSQQLNRCYNVSVTMTPRVKKKGTKETRAVKKQFSTKKQKKKKKAKKKAAKKEITFLLADQKEWGRIKRANVKKVSLDYSPDRGPVGCAMCKDFDPIKVTDDFDSEAFRKEYCSEPCSIETKSDPSSLFFFYPGSNVPEKRTLMVTSLHWCGGQMSVPVDEKYAPYFDVENQKGYNGKSYVVNLTGKDVTLYHKKGTKKESKEKLKSHHYVLCDKKDITVEQGTFTQQLNPKNNVHLISMKDDKVSVHELNTK